MWQMMLGQLLVGYFLSQLGWRTPFLLLGLTSLMAAAFLQVALGDPPKGGKEEVRYACLAGCLSAAANEVCLCFCVVYVCAPLPIPFTSLPIHCSGLIRLSLGWWSAGSR